MRISALAALAALLLIGPAARADLVPPPPPVKKDVPIKVEIDDKAKESKLLIPQSLTRVGRPIFPKGPVKDKGFEKKEDEAAEAPQVDGNGNLIVAGIAAAFSVAFAGLWLTRRNRNSTTGMMLLLAAGTAIGVGGATLANGVPPPKPKETAKLPLVMEGKLTFEMVPTGDTIRLVLTTEDAKKLKEEPKKTEK